MSLQRRLLWVLLISAPLVWSLAAWVSADRARHEIDELFDTEIIRLARKVQATSNGATAPPPPGAPAADTRGGADLNDLAIAVWDGQGQPLLLDREGSQLPYRAQAAGFVEVQIGREDWRVYYLQSADGQRLVAAGQRLQERDEVVLNFVASQLLPWLLVLPALLASMLWGLRRVLAPVRALTAELQARGPEDLRAVHPDRVPTDLQPLVTAMNGLFARIESTLARERRFTADAAHELRTPLAVLRAQWDVLRAAPDGAQRREAEARMERGLSRLDRLVTQMLALSRLEATERLDDAQPVAWTPLVEQVMSDLLPLADRRRIELALEGEPAAFALRGDPALLTVLLRNLLDNAVRYAPEDSTVTLRFRAHGLSVENGGPPLSPQALARLGERHWRGVGHEESGSGLGVSIAQRIAALHGLRLRHGSGPEGQGVVVTLGPR